MPRKPRRPRTNPATGEPVVDALALARACLHSNELDMAELWLNAWEEKSPNSEIRAAHCLDSGCMLESAGHFDRAIAHLAAGLALEPLDEHTAYFLNNNTGYMLWKQGHHVKAERFCRAALRADRLRHNAMKNLGNALAGQGRHAEASLQFMHACIAAPRDPRAFHHLEDLVAEQREALLLAWPDLDSRLAELRRRIEPRPSDASRPEQSAPEPSTTGIPESTRRAHEHAKAALDAYESKRFDDSLAECELGLALDPPSYSVRHWLTLLRSRCLMFVPRGAQEQLAWARDAVELDPFEFLSWRIYGLTLADAGHHAEAARAYLNALRRNIADHETLGLLRAHVRKFGAQIELNIPDIRKRVTRYAAVMKKEREAREAAAGQGPTEG